MPLEFWHVRHLKEGKPKENDMLASDRSSCRQPASVPSVLHSPNGKNKHVSLWPEDGVINRLPALWEQEYAEAVLKLSRYLGLGWEHPWQDPSKEGESRGIANRLLKKQATL